MAVNKDKISGKWFFRVYITEPMTGNRKQIYKGGYELKRDALEAEVLLVNSYLNNEIVLDDIVFDDLLAEYLLFLEKDVKTTTSVGYVYQINKHILPFFSNMKIRNIKRNKIEDWYQDILKKDFGYRYKNKLLTRLKGIFKFAEDQYNFRLRFLNTFPAFRKTYNENRRKNVIYTAEMFNELIKHTENSLEYTIVNTLYFTGLRIGEFRALTWNDISLDENSISITKQITSKIPGQSNLVMTPKSESSIRNVQIPNKLVDVLKNWYNERKEIKGFDESWNLFGDLNYISENTIRRMVKKLTSKANLPYLTLHDFRHSYSTLLRNYKIDPKIVQAQAGHSSVQITLDTYTHIEIEEQRRIIIDLFNNVL